MAALFGTNFADVMIGTFANDTISSFSGDDMIYGTAGFDFVDGSDGADTLDYGLLGGPIVLGAEGLVNKSGLGIDVLFQVENIIAPAGQPNLINGTTDSGTGVSLTVDLAAGGLVVNGIPTIGTLVFGVANFNHVLGTSQGDDLSGNSASNYLDGGSGDDTLFGDHGSDYLVGGEGSDTLDGGTGADVLLGGAGSDFMLGFSGADYMDGGSGDDTISGENGNDYIFASSGNDAINGGTGFDIVDYSGVAGPITLGAEGWVDKGSAGSDQVQFVESILAPAGEFNLIDGTSDSDSGVSLTVNLTTGNLTVNNIPGIGNYGFTVANFIDVVGTSQGDIIVGDSQGNLLDGQGGDDLLLGQAGDDLLFGFEGNDLIDGGAGLDVLYGEGGQDTLLGFDGDDVLIGGTGSDVLLGEVGNDALVGFGFGGEEYDVMVGGSGADYFVLGDSSGTYYTGAGYGIIADFDFAEGDLIQLSGASSYSLAFQNVEGGAATDTLIYAGSDLIGVVADTTNVVAEFDFVIV